MSPTKSSGVAVVPYTLFDAYERGRINQTQFTVLCLLYRWADHKSGVVRDFSAERVLRFMHRHIDNAALKAMRQEIAKLRDMGWFDNDYQRGSKRPYNVFINGYTNPVSFYSTPFHTQVGDETKETVGEKVRDSVRDEDNASYEKTKACQNPLNFGVREDVGENGHRRSQGKSSLKINSRQGNGESKERNRVDSTDAEGSSDDRLHESALRFSGVVDLIFDFVPNSHHVESLLNRYKPTEVLFALTDKFLGRRVNKNTMAHFFRRGAEEIINTRRLEGTSETEPDWYARKAGLVSWNNREIKHQEFLAKWTPMLTAYKEIFPDAQRDDGCPNVGPTERPVECPTGHHRA